MHLYTLDFQKLIVGIMARLSRTIAAGSVHMGMCSISSLHSSILSETEHTLQNFLNQGVLIQTTLVSAVR